MEKMVSGARGRLAAVAPIPVTMGRVATTPSVTLVVEPMDALNPVLTAVREAADAAGCQGYQDTDPWTPHVSVAYSHSDGLAAPIITALGRWLPKTEMSIKSISLVSQTQMGYSWQWEPVAEVHLAEDPRRLLNDQGVMEMANYFTPRTDEVKRILSESRRKTREWDNRRGARDFSGPLGYALAELAFEQENLAELLEIARLEPQYDPARVQQRIKQMRERDIPAIEQRIKGLK
jgi:hypothetical protein